MDLDLQNIYKVYSNEGVNTAFEIIWTECIATLTHTWVINNDSDITVFS